MSLANSDKAEIKTMIKDGSAHLPTVAFIRSEINKFELIMKDTNSDALKILVMLRDNLKVKTQVDDYEVRLTDIEAEQPGIMSNLAMHSR